MPTAEGLYTKEEYEAGIASAIKERTKNHSARLIELEDEVKAANKELRAAQKLTAEAENIAKERDEARAELATTRDGLTLTRHGVTEDRAAKRLRLAYQSDVADLAADKRPSLEDWLKGDGADDLKRYAADGKADPKADARPDAKPGVVTVSAGARPGGGQPTMTADIYGEQMRALTAERGRVPADQRGAVDVKIADLRSRAPTG